MDVAILIYDGFTALDAVGPYEVLSRLPDTKVYFVAKNAGSTRTDNKILSLVADFELSEVLHLPECGKMVAPSIYSGAEIGRGQF